MSKTPSLNMMDCAQVRRWVQQRLDGDFLPPDDRVYLDGHLEICEICGYWSAQIERAIALIAVWQEPKPTAQFTARLMKVLGLSAVPAWVRWAASVAIGLAGAWIASLFVFGERLSERGTPWLVRVLGFSRQLSTLGSAANISPARILEVVAVFFGAALTLLIMGVLAGKMVNRTRTSTLKDL